MQLDLGTEWLETNGIGGYAGSTVCGANTRRYHALLCAATNAPQGRAVLVSKVDESLAVNNAGQAESFHLGTNLWPNAISPRGYEYIEEFTLDPLPRWVFRVPGPRGYHWLQKTLWMPAGQNTSVLEYVLLEGTACELRVKPYIPARNFHLARRESSTFNKQTEISPGIVALKPYPELPWVVFSHDGRFEEDGQWYYDFEWPLEKERGLEFHEDAFCPGVFHFKLQPGERRILMTSTSPQSVALAAASKSAEVARRIQIAGSEVWGRADTKLKLGASQFLVRDTEKRPAILGGYPWFGEWGRDAMVSLPGLCLCTGRVELARDILLRTAGMMQWGLIPNFMSEEGGDTDYSSADTTLWFFWAVQQFLEKSGDWETVKQLYAKLVDSIEWHLSGTEMGVAADVEDGMLCLDEMARALTWMNACVGGEPVTPRSGKPVEIQALWYNALRFMAYVAKELQDEATSAICNEWAVKISVAFQDLFWNEDEQCLYDCVSPQGKDPSVRPNQIFAVSMPYSLLSEEQEKAVVDCVARDLLTPYGLRTLSPGDKRYRGVYQGSMTERDCAYHEGTVRSWLMGPFLQAFLKVNGYSPASKRRAMEWLQPLIGQLDQAGLNSISQLFDGDAPHKPRGAPAQAWSVAELLRALDLAAVD